MQDFNVEEGLYKVLELPEEESARMRLENLGLTRGGRLYIKGSAPLGDPVLVTIRGTDYALRKSTLAKIRFTRL